MSNNGYSRQSANIVTGGVIDAADFNAEYNAIESAFNGSTGHTHDGTAGMGPPIEKVGPAADLVITATVVRPKTHNVLDLGTNAIRYKDAYLEGRTRTKLLTVEQTSTLVGNVTANADVQVDGNLTVSGNATISGNLTFGDADTDSINLTAEIDSNIIPNGDGAYDLGSSTKEWKDLFITGTANIDSLVADTVDINAGSIDGTTIGANSSAAITATTINGTVITASTNFAGDITGDVTSTGTSSFGNISSSGTATLSTADINGGNIDGTTIGASTAAAITGTTITGSSLVGPLTGNVTGNVTGNLTGDVTGDVTGNVTGNVTGTVSSISNHDTDSLSEGTSNLYFTEARARNALSAGEGIDFSGGTISAELAAYVNKGVASFASTDFDVSSGAVSIKDEYVQDVIGAMVSSNTEDGISVTYNDSTGKLNFEVAAQSGTDTTFVLEDGDGNEVTIAHNKEVKFVEGGGIVINWTDTSTGSDGDPYDLTFTHADTSSQSSVNNSGSTVIQDITLDAYGHVTNINSKTITEGTSSSSSTMAVGSLGVGIPAGTGVGTTTHNAGTSYAGSSISFGGTAGSGTWKCMSPSFITKYSTGGDNPQILVSGSATGLYVRTA